MSRKPIAAALVLISTLAMAPVASGQATPPAASDSGERVNQVIVYGDDPCPAASSPDEITVCARKNEGERYRIPEALRGVDNPTKRAWTDRVLAYETVGRAGTMSCTPVGPGGYTGCAQKLIGNAYAERRDGGQDKQFSDLIAAERARRLSTVDRDAAETQARVEQAEREYDARRRAASGQPAASAATGPATPAPAREATPGAGQ